MKQNASQGGYLHVIPDHDARAPETNGTASPVALGSIVNLGQQIAHFAERVRVFAKQCEELTQHLSQAAEDLQGPEEELPAKDLARRLSRTHHLFEEMRGRGLSLAREIGIEITADAAGMTSRARLEALLEQIEEGWLLRLNRHGQVRLALDILERFLRVVERDGTALAALLECQAQAAALRSFIVRQLDPESLPEVTALAEGQHPYCLFLFLLECGDELDQAEWERTVQKLEESFSWELTRAVIRRRLEVRPPTSSAADPPVPPSQEQETVLLPVGNRARFFAPIMEALALALAATAPWALYSTLPLFESCLYTGVFVLLSLWGARMLWEGELVWRKCPVVVGLGALWMFGLFQIVPVPFVRVLSPAAGRIYDQFLPSVLETLPVGVARLVPFTPSGSTLSLFPGASWRELMRLLAIVGLFAAVRNNFPASSLHRLSVVGLINGAALALLGLLQYFSSPHDTIYWTLRGPGDQFFITAGRNHAPFYLNICIGLGLGLLLWVRMRSTGNRGKRRRLRRRSSGFEPRYLIMDAVLILKDAWQLWIIVALVLMIAAVIICQSRGAFVALVGAAASCCVLHVIIARSVLFRPAVGLVVLSLVAFLLGWLGFEWTSSRVVATLWTNNPLDDGRVQLWKGLVQPIREFPVWGTGLGTFGFVEYSFRESSGDEHIFNGHAYNEYLHALLEGGVIRLVLTLLIVGLIARAGCRAYRSLAGTPAGGLVLGALFGLATMLIHCCFDPGIRLPANAFLGTLLCAELCIVGGNALHKAGPTAAAGGSTLEGATARLRLPLLLAATVAVVLPGMLLFREGVRFVETQQALESARAALEYADPIHRELQIKHLEDAAKLSPENAWVQLELAEANLAMFKEHSASLQKSAQAVRAAEVVAGLASQPGGARQAALAGAAAARDSLIRNQLNMLMKNYLGAALQRYLLARDLCPLLPPPHVRLAAYADYLPTHDPRERYLERAKRLIPSDPEFWYLCGVKEIADGQHELAWESWKRSLLVGDTYFPAILAKSRTLLSPGEILARVLPDRPALIYRAAQGLFGRPESVPEGRPFLERLLDCVTQKPEAARTATELYLQALAHQGLQQWDRAFDSYEKALERNPKENDWRFEYAKLLYERGRTQEARRELAGVLKARPDHVGARELYQLGRTQGPSGDAP